MNFENLTPGPFDLGGRINAVGAYYQIVSLAPPDQLGNRPATSLLASSVDDALRVVRLLNAPAPMSLEKAHEINAACCQTVLSRLVEGKLIPLPKQHTLEELVIASRLIAADPGELDAEGRRRMVSHVDPRALALHYAFDNYSQSPIELLEALGFSVDGDSVGFCQACGMFIADHLLKNFQTHRVCQACHEILGSKSTKGLQDKSGD